MHFDWYQATILARPEQVLDALSAGLPDVETIDGKGLHGYAKLTNVLSAGQMVASVLSGGPNGLPNAWATGERAEPFAAVIRRDFPQHRVTRFDACEDYDEPGAFDRVCPILLSLSDKHKLKPQHAGDWHNRTDGATLYLGSPKSAVRTRWYEKGKQLRKLLLSHGVLRPDWCRLEVQVRPHGTQRLAAAIASPLEAWGYSRWTPQVLRVVTAQDVKRAAPSTFREPEWRNSYMHMIRQYAGVLQRRYEAIGSNWEDVGIDIGLELKRLIEENPYNRPN